MKIALRLLIGLSLAGCISADLPPPRPVGQPIHMRIARTSVGAGGAVLQIPARLLAKHAGLLDLAVDRPQGGGNLIVAGMLLSAAIFFLGRWLWKRKKRGIDLGLVAIALLGAGTLVHEGYAANGDLNEAVQDGQLLEGTVTVQIVNDSEEVVLNLTPSRRPRP